MNSRRCYVATGHKNHEAAADFAAALRRMGYRTTSRWHDLEQPDSEAHLSRGERHAVCGQNLEDLRDAGTLILLAVPGMAGAWVELGIAWHAGKRVLIVGPPDQHTLMALLPGCDWAADEAAALAMLRREAA